MIAIIIGWTLFYTCVIDRLRKCSNWTLLGAVPCWVICKILNRSLWAGINTLILCHIPILFARTIFHTFKSQPVTPCVMNFSWTYSYTTSRNIISKVINSSNNLTHFYTFSYCRVCWMFKRIIPGWTYRHTSPSGIILIKGNILSCIKNLQWTIRQTTSISIVSEFKCAICTL